MTIHEPQQPAVLTGPLSRRALVVGAGALGALGAAASLGSAGMPHGAWAAPGVPFLAPGVKRWLPQSGTLRLGSRIDVVIAPGAGDRAAKVADRLARDLRARGRRSRVRAGRVSRVASYEEFAAQV